MIPTSELTSNIVCGLVARADIIKELEVRDQRIKELQIEVDFANHAADSRGKRIDELDEQVKELIAQRASSNVKEDLIYDLLGAHPNEQIVTAIKRVKAERDTIRQQLREFVEKVADYSSNADRHHLPTICQTARKQLEEK